jgi:hypothetical protein
MELKIALWGRGDKVKSIVAWLFLMLQVKKGADRLTKNENGMELSNLLCLAHIEVEGAYHDFVKPSCARVAAFCCP